MQFHSRKRRSPPSIIIVSLIDVLIVVLIFMMVTTTFKQQAAINLALPESKQSKQGASDRPALIVTVPKNGPVYLGTEPVTFDKLQEKLTAAVKKDPELQLSIKADTEAGFGQIIKVMDAAKASNVKALNAFTKSNVTP